jgi:moderate conductance mechanosensitive channel
MRSPLGTFEWVNAFPAQTQLDSTCGAEPSWICQRLFEITDGNRVIPALVDSVLSVLVIVLVAWIAAALARRYFGRLVARLVTPDRSAPSRQLARLGDRAGGLATTITTPIGIANEPDPRREARIDSISTVVESTATVIIWTIAGITALGEMGVNLAPLIAGAGIAGVALGFGAQSLVKDCIAGLFMLLEDQYGIGDVVDLDEAAGTVEQISLRTTVLRGVDGTVWHVPNGVVQRVGNRSQLWSVALIDVSVAYDCDLAAARQVIIDAATDLCSSEEWSTDVIDPPLLLGVEALGIDGITIRVTVKTQPGAQWALQRALRESIKAALDGAGIEIPFPQRTVWVRHGSGGESGPNASPADDPFAAAP